MDSLNSLDRLLEAEAKATALIKEAEAEASSILSQAQEDIHRTEKNRLADERLAMEKEFSTFQAEVADRLKHTLEEYTTLLDSIPLDKHLFEQSCKTLISHGA